MFVERWRPAQGRKYDVSDLGRIRTRADGRIVEPRLSTGGYLMVGGRFVHLLVLYAFKGPPPYVHYQCCHGNDVKTDCRLANLRWDKPAANAADAVRNGKRKGIDRGQIAAIRTAQPSWTNQQIASAAGVVQSTVWRVLSEMGLPTKAA